MNRFMRGVHDVAASPWVVLIGTLASVSSFLWMFHDQVIAPTPSSVSIVAFILSITFMLGVGMYSARIRQTNRAFADAMKHIHKINHDYRDVLHAMFHGPKPETDPDRLCQAEEQTLRSVCQRLRDIFDGLIGKASTVTVKLITKEASGTQCCSTYVRSEENCERDQEEPTQFAVGKWKNTAFDKALLPSEAGECSHFCSPDLTKEKQYNNERQHWDRFYRGTIVVPIRSVTRGGESAPDTTHDVGFLCVDTRSRNRLRGGYQVYLLAAFADQMYNFLSLMRGKYKVSISDKEGSAQ